MKAGACFEIGNIVIMNRKTIIGLGFCLIIIFMKNNEDLGGWYHVCNIHNSSYHTSLNSFMLKYLVFNMYIFCRQWEPAFLLSDPLCRTWLSGMWYIVILLGNDYAAQFCRG